MPVYTYLHSLIVADALHMSVGQRVQLQSLGMVCQLSRDELPQDSLYIQRRDKDSLYIQRHDKDSLYIERHDKDSLYIQRHDKDSLYIHTAS